MQTDISDARSVSTTHRRCKMPQKCTFRTFDVPCKETAKTIVIRSRVRSRNAFFRMRGRYRPHIAGASLINTQNSNKLHLFYFFFLFRACGFSRLCFESGRSLRSLLRQMQAFARRRLRPARLFRDAVRRPKSSAEISSSAAAGVALKARAAEDVAIEDCGISFVPFVRKRYPKLPQGGRNFRPK